ncbi:group 1 truncated hemoglobin [Aestuariibacter sp. GS-14]|uniref:group I truncated hemoglobin n=1 Tax=Aestuariibacter sp. GS-14 TaxID=2590670 RepID=UPI0015E86A8B|nr:group 1 truncated hemoglobin [Aestuariibacter sp. GS-14]
MVKGLLFIAVCGLLFVTGCVSRSETLYVQLGGQAKIDEVVKNFVREIEFNNEILPFFADTNIDRFTEKFAQQLCVFADGPCDYTGDSMEQVHGGMHITEAQFNLTVDLFITAMDKANVPHRLQNQLISRMTFTRKQMLYK